MIFTTVDAGFGPNLKSRAYPIAEWGRNILRVAAWRERHQHYSDELERAALHRSDNTPTSSDAAGDSSRPSGWEVFSECVGGFVLAAFFIFATIVVMGLDAKPEPAEVECAHQWTSDTRYVEICE